jgi:hypothetical protein
MLREALAKAAIEEPPKGDSVFAATAKRIRTLPIDTNPLKSAG